MMGGYNAKHMRGFYQQCDGIDQLHLTSQWAYHAFKKLDITNFLAPLHTNGINSWQQVSQIFKNLM